MKLPALATPTTDVWILRVLWLILPFTTSAVVSEALSGTSSSFETTVSIGLYVIWGLGMVATSVRYTATLTLMRLLAPAMLAGVVWASFVARDDVEPRWLLALAVISAVATSAFALSATVGDAFVDGASYGDETRFLLRTPGALLLGPIEIVWALIVAGAVAGPLLLAAQRWILGGVALVLGWALVYFAVPIVHRLSNRWLVFVPAGVVVHDKTALREPQLFRKESIAAFGPAPADTELEDLTLGGSGLALRAELTESSKIIKNSRTEPTELTDVDGWVVSPNRPGAVVAEAKARGFTIG